MYRHALLLFQTSDLYLIFSHLLHLYVRLPINPPWYILSNTCYLFYCLLYRFLSVTLPVNIIQHLLMKKKSNLGKMLINTKVMPLKCKFFFFFFFWFFLRGSIIKPHQVRASTYGFYDVHGHLVWQVDSHL